jgi:hypothetical protein
MTHTHKHAPLFIAALIIIVAGFFVYQTMPADAIGGQYFGGTIEMMEECTCGDGSMVLITGQAGSSGTYLYTDSAKKYNEGNVSAGRNVLGSYSPGGECEVEAGEDCIDIPITKGTIDSIATN